MTFSAASSAWPLLSATTIATMSPTNRTFSVASGGRFIVGGSMTNPWTSGSSRSAAVYTATTPGIERRIAGVDRHDVRVRNRGAHEGDVQEPVHLQVVVVLRLTGEDPRILLAEHRIAENRARLRHCSSCTGTPGTLVVRSRRSRRTNARIGRCGPFATPKLACAWSTCPRPTVREHAYGSAARGSAARISRWCAPGSRPRRSATSSPASSMTERPLRCTPSSHAARANTAAPDAHTCAARSTRRCWGSSWTAA